jgi:DNA-binding MarR family transcriptional regulator
VLTNLISSAIAGAYRERFGLSIPEWRVLAVLANSPDLSAAEVAQRTAMDKVAVSRAVRSLLNERAPGAAHGARRPASLGAAPDRSRTA